MSSLRPGVSDYVYFVSMKLHFYELSFECMFGGEIFFNKSVVVLIVKLEVIKSIHNSVIEQCDVHFHLQFCSQCFHYICFERQIYFPSGPTNNKNDYYTI